MHIDIPQLVTFSKEYGTFMTSDGATFLSEYLDIYRYSGIVNKNRVTSLSEPTGTDDDTIVIGEKTFADTSGISEDYLGCEVNVYVRENKNDDFGEVIYVEETPKNKTVTVCGEDEPYAKGYIFSYYQGNAEKELKISPIVKLIYNGKATTYNARYIDVDNGYVKLIDNDNDKVYDVISVVEYENYVVDRASVENEKIFLKHGYQALDLKNENYTIYSDDKKIGLDEIISGAVISVAASEEGISSTRVFRIDVSTNSFIPKSLLTNS